MSPESLAVINFLKSHGAQKFEALEAAFPRQTHSELSKRLHNLKANRWVDRYEEDRVVFWELREDARHRDPQMPRTRGIQVTPKPTGETPPADEAEQGAEPPLPIVPPRRVDVMNGPTYQPTPTYIARPGALDASHISSHGLRC